MDENQLLVEIRRLRSYNQLWAVLWIVTALGVFLFATPMLGRKILAPSCRKMDGGGLRVSTMHGPTIVTHLVAKGNRLHVAPLSKPITIVDSEGAEISREEFAKLSWQCEGGPCEAPPADAKYGVLYQQPELIMEEPKSP
jgi:hypothetical protein